MTQMVYRQITADWTSLEHIGDMTSECGSIRLNIGPKVIMTRWNSQMRGSMDHPNPKEQVTK